METEIRMEEKEFIYLVQLVFIGNYVINGIRKEEEQVKEYNDVAEKVYRKEYELYNQLPGEEAEANELADIWDEAYDIVHTYMEAFERDAYLEKLAKRITYQNYPIIPFDKESLLKHWAAEEEYRKILKEKGAVYVQMTAPKIDELLKIKEQEKKEE